MAAITAADPSVAPVRSGQGFWARGFARVIAARQRQAERIVAAHLMTLDDATLASLGHDRRELRAAAGRSPSFI